MNKSDRILRQVVLRELAAEPCCDGVAFRVGVVNGVVHLSARLSSCLARSRAEEVAASLPGVRGVVNRIEAPGAPNPARNIFLDFTDGE